MIKYLTMQQVYLYIFSCIGTLIASVFGACLPYIFKKEHSWKATSLLMTISASVITALLFLELIPEAIEGGENMFSNRLYGILICLGIILCVGSIFFGISKLIPHFHGQIQGDCNCDDCQQAVIDANIGFAGALIYLAAIFVHNIPEGFVFGTLFNTEGFPLSGLMMAISLFFHNLVISYSLSVQFYINGCSKTFSILMTSASGLFSFILAIVGYYTSANVPSVVITILYAVCSGSLLYVLIKELIPPLFYELKDKNNFLVFLITFVLTALLLLLE